jgi:23S rRNA A1618 N6-methylase RlmF
MDTVKMGYYFTKSGEKRQRYKCKGCRRTFVPKVIALLIHLDDCRMLFIPKSNRKRYFTLIDGMLIT